MDMEELPGCCGVDVLNGFDDIESERWDDKLQNYRDTNDGDMVAYIRDCLLATKQAKRGLVLAVTNKEETNKQAAKLLKAFGFTELKRFKNPRHNSSLTMWEYPISRKTVVQIKKRAKDLGAPNDES